ncbi:nucleotidyltransferase domain protein [Peptococcaceae bacterium CEB3]|nr:nucleotidyltransferase domain protein [Peptococcaceae bacterium CEB3]
MEKRIQDELNTLKKVILDTVPVEQIYLFGSYAEGTPHADSDLDVYVVMPADAGIREIDAMIMIRKALRNIKTMPLDIVVGKADKFDQLRAAPTIEQEIAQEGVKLYE